ncbi:MULTISPECIES: hydrophobic protein [unclassified Streptomyces]|uniref:hydrophobic protein n=1 Tax=unclassified Streptomyces TaxID=2593676 RepID=UPI002E27E0D7|nr:hydrophobic protein [Streptomyces sp. NBC_01429]
MGALLIVLLIVLIVFGLGFVLHALWWIAVVLFVLWLLGFLIRRPSSGSGSGAGNGRGRWYRW